MAKTNWQERQVSLAGSVAVAAVTLVLGVFAGMHWEQLTAQFLPLFGIKTSAEIDWSELNEVYGALSSDYNGELDQETLIEGAKKGMVAALDDPYTVYMTAEEYDEFEKDLHGEVGAGIGVEMGERDGYIRVIRTLPDNPAREAGVLAGDIIYKVEGEEVYNLTNEEIASRLKGEPGTEVNFSVVRDGEELEFTVTREEINNVSAYANYDGDTAIVNITRFDTDTGEILSDIADEIEARGIQKIVLDLRGNGGGYVSAAKDIASLWIDGDLVVTQKSLKTGNTVTPADVTNHVFNFPVRKGKNTVALFVKSGSEGWKVFCGAVPFREKLDNVTTILRSPEWRPVKMDPVEWVYVQPRRIPMLDVKPGTALDLSGFLDRAPKIGELGRIIVNQEGKLAYEKEPSRTVRFRSFTIDPGAWQNRLYAMSKPEIEEYAEAIRLRGFNMVRIQAPDGALTGKNGYPKKPITLREATLPRTMEELPIDKTFADRWDYFVACLRKRNIYLLPDIASTRTSWTAATVEFDVKTGLLFREDYRENWRAGFHYMMKHRNPYTGTRMVDDPMIVGITLFNEQDNQKNYWNELNPYWQKHFAAVHPGETAPVLNLELLQKSQEARDWLEETLTGMSKFYMEEVRNVGFRGIVTNWDMYMRLMDIPPRLPLTAVAMHTYFSHPNRVALPVRNYQQKLYNLRWYRGTGFLTGQTSSITDRNSYIGRAGVNRFFDRPFLITEYSHSPYNRYVHEAGLMWGAYAALQGWDMLTQHGTPVSLWHTPMNGYVFEGSLSPMARVNEILTAFAWQRGDVAEAAHKVEIAIPERVMHSADFMNAIGGEYSRLFMVTRLGCSCEGQGSVRDSLKIVPERFARTFGGGMFAEVRETRGGDELARQLVRELREKRVIGQNNLTDPDRGIYQSETGEITTDVQKQTLRVVTKRLEGAVLKENQPVKLDALTISESSVPASLTAVALDAAPDLRSSRRILLVAATMAVSEHTVFNNERFDVEIDFGKFPVLIRSGKFALTLENRSAGKPEVYALNLEQAASEYGISIEDFRKLLV